MWSMASAARPVAVVAIPVPAPVASCFALPPTVFILVSAIISVSAAIPVTVSGLASTRITIPGIPSIIATVSLSAPVKVPVPVPVNISCTASGPLGVLRT